MYLQKQLLILSQCSYSHWCTGEKLLHSVAGQKLTQRKLQISYRDVPRFKRVVHGYINLQNLVIFNIYAQTVSRIPCRHFVLCKVVGKTKHFIHADI